MTPEEKADSICKWTNQGLRDLVVMAIKEAVRDQRHACAEAVAALEGKFHTFGDDPCVRKNVAYQAVMNADVR
jgi:hypothetical protein